MEKLSFSKIITFEAKLTEVYLRKLKLPLLKIYGFVQELSFEQTVDNKMILLNIYIYLCLNILVF